MRHLIAVVILLELLGACQLPPGPHVDPTAPLWSCSPTGDGGQLCRQTNAPGLFGPYARRGPGQR